MNQNVIGNEEKEQHRLLPVDALRGLIIVLMALDHANYFVAQQYVTALGKFAESSHQKTFFLPMDSASVIGAIGGIAEIARDAMAQRSAQRSDGPWGGGDGA